jgi:LmeA-like phospholipid-binding
VPRLLTRSIVLVAVLAVVAVAADRVAAMLAARTVSQNVTASARLGRPADVRFPTVPFLTQAAAGRYDVDVTMQGVPTRGGLVLDRIDASLRGVSAPAGPLLAGHVQQLPVDSGDAVVYVSFAALQAAVRRSVGARADGLSFARAAADRVAVAETLQTAVGSFTVRGQAQLTVKGSSVVVHLLPDTVTGVPALVRSNLGSLVDLTVLTPALPFGLRPTAVAVDDNGLRLTAAGTHLVLPARTPAA